MPKPQDPTKAPRLRWSPEEIDRLVREAAMLMLAAERNGKAITKNKAVALAQYVLPKDRQREVGPDYNPSWMASEGRIEALLEQLRSELPPVAQPPSSEPASASASPPAADQAPEPAPAEQAAGKNTARKTSKSAKLREQPGLFPEPPHGRTPRVKDVAPETVAPDAAVAIAAETEAAPAPAQAEEFVHDAPSAAAAPAPAHEAASSSAHSPSPAAYAPAEREPSATPAAAVQEETAAVVAPQQGEEPLKPVQEDMSPAIVNALATLGTDVLAAALRTVATKAFAGLLVEALRQPEVQAALRDALGGPPRKKPFGERNQAETEARSTWPKAQRETREAREPAPRLAEPRPAAAPRPLPAQAPADNQQVEEPALARERDSDVEVEPVLFDPNAWQSTPLHALPERTARGASEPPKPRVVMFGLLPKDQQRLKAEFGQKYKLRFGSGSNLQHALDIAKDVDKIYSMVRFIPRELDRGLAGSGVPYSPMNNLGELRHELAVNPPLPRGELI